MFHLTDSIDEARRAKRIEIAQNRDSKSREKAEAAARAAREQAAREEREVAAETCAVADDEEDQEQ